MPLRVFQRAGLVCAALACLFAAGTAGAADLEGRRLKGGEIKSLINGKTFEATGNIMAAFPWQTWIHPKDDGTFKMVSAVEWLELLKNEPAQIHKLGEHGKWWLEGDRLCLQFLHRASGAKDCFEVRDVSGEYRLHYTQCTMVSTDRCQAGRVAYAGKFVAGDTVPTPDPTN